MLPIARISREELLDYVRNELTCTIGSADAPITIAVLITTFREDTSEDILQLAKKLGYPSIEAMLASREFAHIVEPCYTDLAKGAGNEKPKKVFCYRVKSNPEIAHILSSIEESNQYKEAKLRQKELLVGDPKNNPSILNGKEMLLKLIHELGGQEHWVELGKLQNLYKQSAEGELNKRALKKYFPTGHVKTIMDKYLYEDVELATDTNKNGSLLFRLKRPFKEIYDEIVKIRQEQDQYREEQRKSRTSEKKKKPKGPAQQPKKLKVINPPPPPKPKPVPLVRSMVQRAPELYTDDPQLFQKIALAGEAEQSVEQATAKSSVEYTSRVDGATYTDDEQEDSEEDGDSGDGDEDEEVEEEADESVSEEEQEEEMVDTLKSTSTQPPNGVEPAKEAQKRNGHVAGGGAEEQQQAEEEEQATRRLRLVGKKLQRRREFEDQVMMRQQEDYEVEGVFTETKRFGQRARDEEARRERVNKLLERMSRQMAEQEPLVVDKLTSEKSRQRIAALVVQMIWTNRELGLSEVRNALSLMFGYEVQMDVERFIKMNCKCVKLVRAPIEPHLVIKEGAKKQISTDCTKLGKIHTQKAVQNKVQKPRMLKRLT